MNPELRDLRGRTEKLRQELHQIIKEAGEGLDMNKVTCIQGDSAAKVAYMQALNLELDETVKKAEPLEKEESIINQTRERLKKFGEPLATHPGFPSGMSAPQPGTFDAGKAFMDAWREGGGLQKGRTYEIDLGEGAIKQILARDAQMKALMTTAAGWAPATVRTGRLVEEALRPIQVTDIIPGGSTSNSAVTYMEETTATNTAAEKAEGVAYPEATLVLTEQSVPVRKIAVWLPVTDEQLEDVPQVTGYINNRLPFFLRQRLDGQLVNGDGIAPNIQGVSTLATIQTQAKGADPVPDAVYKAMTKIRVTGRANPSAVIFHPTNWQDVRLLRTADGLYIWGSPTEPGPDRIWGLPVALADAHAAGTAWVGDYAGFCEFDEKRGVEVKVSDSHGTYFVEGKQAIRADFRGAAVWYRPEAFCEVTGL